MELHNYTSSSQRKHIGCLDCIILRNVIESKWPNLAFNLLVMELAYWGEKGGHVINPVFLTLPGAGERDVMEDLFTNMAGCAWVTA